MKNNFFSLLLIFVWIFSLNENLPAQTRKSPPRKTVVARQPKIIQSAPANLTPERQRRLDAFNFTWQTIKTNYFDQTFSGLDWDKIKKEFEPRVLRSATDAQLHDILQEMINRLNRSHFAVIPPEVYQAIENAKAEARAKEEARQAAGEDEMSGEEETDDEESDFGDYSAKYGIGVELRLIENQFVVTRVEANSAAEKAGMKTGGIVEKINDVSLFEMLKQIEIHYAKIRNIKKYLPGEVVTYMLNGEKDSFVALTVSSETGQAKEFKVQREQLKGEMISIGNNYPEQFLKFEAVSLNEQTGYIKFNVFALPVIEKFCAALTELKDKRAIIIDLRGNAGGILGILIGLGGMLTEKPIDLGTSIYKVGSENMVAESKAKNYKGRLVFLVDNQTASAAEVFAAALQENNRALVVGEKTAGEALPSVSVQLPTGAVLLYPIANFKTRNGNYLEGKGVEPNFIAALDRKSLLTGIDAPLETALKLIKEDTAFPKSVEGKITILTADKPPPPAPKPIAVPKGRLLAEVTVKAPPPPVPVYKKDAKALQVITDFVGIIGGEEALSKINTYALKGTSGIAAKGTKVEAEIDIFRQKPDKYAEVVTSEAIGEVRQIYNGNNTFLQTDYGLNRKIAVEINTAEIEIFAPLNNLFKKETFKSLNYQGAFDRMGKQAHVIEAVTANGQTVWLAFDVETKLLVGYTGQFFTFFYDDYRRVENVMLPFHITKESFIDIRLNEIKLNPTIEENNFKVKQNCFDKAN
ncbi:MAG: S41 family peptidase [Acidobacteriota bacterium]|nr:S41 family peptidase [Acidobacteriota bacterium]